MCFFRKNPGLAGGLAVAPLALRVLSGVLWEPSEFFQLDLESAGESVLWNEEIRPECLTLTTAKGVVRIAFQDAETVRIQVQGVDLRLDLCRSVPYQLGKSWRVPAGSHGWLIVSPLTGKLTKDRHAERLSFRLHGESETAELLIHRTTGGCLAPDAVGTFEDCVTKQRQDLENWIPSLPAGNAEFSDLFFREAANLWNLSVAPLGNVRREMVLVSKGSLVGLWSWDHCWHMLGTAPMEPVVAWNTYMAMFDHQDKSGCLPDVLCANQVYWAKVKPPVHGWILSLLEARHAWYGDEHRREVYEPLSRWTKYWLSERDDDGDGVPSYLHGMDSGWDNATVFDAGVPLESPDLATWLILQQEELAKIAHSLGRHEEAERWETGAKRLLESLLEHFWTGERFVARLSGSHQTVESDSLILHIPALLGTRLPEKARQWCLQGLLDEKQFLAEGGIRSESLASPKFEPDGYWRGAVWPVTVFIFVEALRANGLTDDAAFLERHYLKHIAKAGNFENYRGDNGVGVRDTAMGWTSSCVSWFLNPQPKAKAAK